MIRKKKKEEEGENLDRWLISYADFITLLFTFFAALYALSTLDKLKAEKFSGSLRQAFSIIEQPIYLYEQRNTMIFEDIRELIHELPGVNVKRDSRGIVITLTDAISFASGSAELTNEIKPFLDGVSRILRTITNKITIEGHTDNVPIVSGRYHSNFELSTARASSVLRYFIDKGLMPDRFAIAGYGEFRPIADNTNADGRARNRRVEIIIHPY
ncbi:MAG: OmpA family protein [Thermodesulfovibrionales bacterium]|nr:OmpA family protein [Thermodesulfovibrionales bacterium]